MFWVKSVAYFSANTRPRGGGEDMDMFLGVNRTTFYCDYESLQGG